MVQAIILLSGGLAIWLTQFGNPTLAQWACLVALPSQPLFLLETYRAKQWGMHALSWIYAGAWGMGIWNFWLKPVVNH
jgi:hypothetical protein